jgi:hypothetical protein
MELLDPTVERARAIIEVDLGNGQYVRARRLDLPQMIFEGLVPQPIMAAAQRLIDTQGQSASAQLGDEEPDAAAQHAAQLETLRRHALTVVLEPRLVLHDDHDPSHLPVDLLTLTQLLAIWNQTAVTPRVSAAQAAHFRRAPGLGSHPPVSPREDVRPAPESVARFEFRSA